ncbi:MAG: hypothetical protein AB9M53_00685 [Leptothrix sp. (in: b-proteobacteria)]
MNTASMIEQAAANRTQFDHPNGFKAWHYESSAVFETEHGKIVCTVDHTKSNPNSRNNQKHCAARFSLNGKVVSRANLNKIIGQV